MSRVGNGAGPRPAPVNRETDFAVFDTLPPEVRRAMNESWFCRTAIGVRPQIATVGAERAAALLGPGAACDQAFIRQEQREAAERADLERMGFYRPRPAVAGGQRERTY